MKFFSLYIKTNRNQFKRQTVKAQFGTKKNLTELAEGHSASTMESQFQATGKCPCTNDANFNLFLSTTQGHASSCPATELLSLVPSITGYSPNQPAKKTTEQISKSLAKKARNMDLPAFTQESHQLCMWSLKIRLSHFQRNLAPISRTRTSPGHRRSQRLFLKRSLRHVENICIAQQGLKSEPAAAISPPLQILQSKQAKRWPLGEAVSCLSLLQAAGCRRTQTGLRTVVRQNKCKARATGLPFHPSDLLHKPHLIKMEEMSLTNVSVPLQMTMHQQWRKLQAIPILKAFFPNCLNNHSAKIYVRSTITGQGSPCKIQITGIRKCNTDAGGVSIYKGRQYATTEVHNIIPKSYVTGSTEGALRGRHLNSKWENGGLQQRARSVNS